MAAIARSLCVSATNSIAGDAPPVVKTPTRRLASVLPDALALTMALALVLALAPWWNQWVTR
jgi:hypothetical protein